jgi:hypothetical protein
MTRIALALLLAACFADHAAAADDARSCAAAGGSLVTGAIVKGPKFAHGAYRQGVELSHTHLKVRADQDGRVYDVAIDNVFANGYRSGAREVPAPLDALHPGQRLALCGQLYDRGVGIHFVHTNCGQAATPQHPDGWIRVLGADGRPGPNLEANPAECALFRRGPRRVVRKWVLH